MPIRYTWRGVEIASRRVTVEARARRGIEDFKCGTSSIENQPVRVGQARDNRGSIAVLPQDVPVVGVQRAHRPSISHAIDNRATTGLEQHTVGVRSRRHASVSALRAGAWQGDRLRPHRSGGQVIAIPGVIKAILVDGCHQRISMGIIEQERCVSKVGIDRLHRVRDGPGGLDSECVGIQSDDRLGQRLRILIARPGRDKNRVGGGVKARRRPDAPANLPLWDKRNAVDNLVRRQAHLQQLARYQGAITDT